MLAPLEMSVPAADGLILKGTLTYPTGRPGEPVPLAVLAHQYPATRDSYAPLVRDLLAAGIATLAFDQRGHGASIVGAKGPVVVDAPEGLGLEAFGAADGPERVRKAIERLTLPVWLGSSEDDPFEGGANVTRWSQGLKHVTTRLVPGTAHAMAIYFDIRDELVSFLRKALGVA
jgi:pimeloyl-ACP methyl ester carboxylesterase